MSFCARFRKIDDDGLQQIGAFNERRNWTRSMVEYLDHNEPLEVFKFVEQYPKGKDTWKNKKRKRKTKYIPKKEKKVLVYFVFYHISFTEIE